MSRYTLYCQGPDDSSTYSQCWGPNPRSRGVEHATADRLADLIAAADAMNHSSWTVRDSHARVTMQPHEFWARKAVQRAIAVARRDD
jgi:hypothetical protein